MMSGNPHCPHCRALAAELARLQTQLNAANTMHRLLPQVAADAVSQALDEAREHCVAASSDGNPSPGAQKAVLAMNAARAQCYRKKLSDDARRSAIKRARALGALPPDFDEDALPWSWKSEQPDEDTEPRKPKPSPRAPRDFLTEQLFILADNVPDKSHPGFEVFIAIRLAQFSGYWEPLRAQFTKMWRDACQRPPGRSSFLRPTIYWPDHKPAVQGQAWFYPDGPCAKWHYLYYLPGSRQIYIDAQLDLRAHWQKITADARATLDRDLVREIEDKLERLDVELVPLALMELVKLTSEERARAPQDNPYPRSPRQRQTGGGS